MDAGAPAGTLTSRHRGVEPNSGDHEERVPGIRVDGEPVALAALAPAVEPAGVHRALHEVAAMEGVADRSRAVVTARLEVGVPAAIAVRRALGNLVPRPDHLFDSMGCAVRGL